MNHNINDSALRYLRKQHKDWSEDKIKAEGEKIWNKYVEDNKDRLDQEAKKDKEAFDKSVEMEFLNLLAENSNISESFFVREFNKRKREKIWRKDEVSMKMSFRFKLTLLEMIDKMPESVAIPEKYLEGEFYRLSLGYRGIGKNSGFASGVRSKASIGIPSNETTNDHLIGTTEVGRYIHEVLKKSDYDIEWMVNTWLYEHLFLWATIKVTKNEHRKENVIRNQHTIEQKLNLEHYKNVSDLV